jgi:hypothetical protein
MKRRDFPPALKADGFYHAAAKMRVYWRCERPGLILKGLSRRVDKVFWLIGQYAPIMENIFYNVKREKIYGCISNHSMFTHRVLWRNDFFV